MTKIGVFTFEAELWLYPAGEGWHFVSLPPDVSEDLRDLTTGLRRGFGSVRVAVTVGATSWRTSVFPDSRTGQFLLPVKKAVRTAEHLGVGGAVRVTLEVLDL